MLQWGRDLTVAGSQPCSLRVKNDKMLQWGRDLTVADSDYMGIA